MFAARLHFLRLPFAWNLRSVRTTEEGNAEEDATQPIEYLVLREKLGCRNCVWMTRLEVDLILTNTFYVCFKFHYKSSSNGRKELESIPPSLHWKSIEQLPGPAKKTVRKFWLQAATRRPVIVGWWDSSRTLQRLEQKQKTKLLK